METGCSDIDPIVSLRFDMEKITCAALRTVDAEPLTVRALDKIDLQGCIHIVAVGKAAFAMARGASCSLNGRFDDGVIVSHRWYAGDRSDVPGFRFLQADHPVPDSRSFASTRHVLQMVDGLDAKDTVVLLLSGGGSAMFEWPLIAPGRLQKVTRELLDRGADIREINTVRKRFSNVKAGRFAQRCAPARVVCLVLSDVIGNPIDTIASGPAYPDATTCTQARAIVDRYGLELDEREVDVLNIETPKHLENTQVHIIGDARSMVGGARCAAEALGYRVLLLDHPITGEAKDEGADIAHRMCDLARYGEKVALIGYGEPIVHVIGSGLGGRAQELALAAAQGIAGLPIAISSVGSDGRDGPTEAAGGYVDGSSVERLRHFDIDASAVLARNDSFHALRASGDLVVTGATGTNVNDLTVGLFNPEIHI